MTPRKNPRPNDGHDTPADDDATAIEGSRDALVAEADQILDLPRADPETHGAAPAAH